MMTATELTENSGKIPQITINREAGRDLGIDAVEEVENAIMDMLNIWKIPPAPAPARSRGRPR
jgi:hypothetical protein